MSEKQKTVIEMTEELPSSLPYAVREAIALLQIYKTDLKRVPEPVFVRDILPVLTGEEGALVDMSWWAYRLDSVYKGFYVVDHADEVLFEVPPLMDRNFKLIPADNARDTVAEASATHSNRVYNRPVQAREEYLAALNKRLDMSGAERSLAHMEMLDKIFIRYGKPSIFEGAASEEVRKLSAAASAVEAPKADNAEDVSYSDEGILD